MPSWEEKGEIGPWFVAHVTRERDSQRGQSSDVYQYAGGPYNSKGAAYTALRGGEDAPQPGDEKQRPDEPFNEYMMRLQVLNSKRSRWQNYEVISAAQLMYLTSPPEPTVGYGPQTSWTEFDLHRVRGFPKEYLHHIYNFMNDEK